MTQSSSHTCQVQNAITIIQELLSKFNTQERASIVEQLKQEENRERIRIAEVLDEIVEDQIARSRRPPNWFRQIRQAFVNRETEPIILDDIMMTGFKQRKSAQNALTQFDQELRRYGYEIVHTPAYQIRPVQKS